MRAGELDLSERKEEENKETNSIQFRESCMIENLHDNIWKFESEEAKHLVSSWNKNVKVIYGHPIAGFWKR